MLGLSLPLLNDHQYEPYEIKLKPKYSNQISYKKVIDLLPRKESTDLEALSNFCQIINEWPICELNEFGDTPSNVYSKLPHPTLKRNLCDENESPFSESEVGVSVVSGKKVCMK